MCLLRGTSRNFTIHLTNPSPYIDRTVAHEVSRRPLAAEAQFQVQAGPSEICGGQRDTATIFPPSRIPVSPVSIIPPMLLPGGKKGRNLGVFKITVLIRKFGSIG
jgi:hypothetical protein